MATLPTKFPCHSATAHRRGGLLPKPLLDHRFPRQTEAHAVVQHGRAKVTRCPTQLCQPLFGQEVGALLHRLFSLATKTQLAQTRTATDQLLVEPCGPDKANKPAARWARAIPAPPSRRLGTARRSGDPIRPSRPAPSATRSTIPAWCRTSRRRMWPATTSSGSRPTRPDLARRPGDDR